MTKKRYSAPGLAIAIFDDKQKLIDYLVAQMLTRTQRIFEWSGLPDTIPQRDLEDLLQEGGFAAISEIGEDHRLAALGGGLSGEQRDDYSDPTILTYAGPSTGSGTLDLKDDKDGVLIRGDSRMLGLLPMCSRYAILMAECEFSIKTNELLARIPAIASANDDATALAINGLFKQSEETGVPLAVTSYDVATGVGVSTNSFAPGAASTLKELVELEQYLKGQWYIDLGLNAAFNMKREALSESENGLADDSLLPLIDDMLWQRRDGARRINAKFGLSVSVDFSSAWKRVREEEQAEIDAAEASIGEADREDKEDKEEKSDDDRQ